MEVIISLVREARKEAEQGPIALAVSAAGIRVITGFLREKTGFDTGAAIWGLRRDVNRGRNARRRERGGVTR
jgi:hypothetical protein